MEKKHSFRLFYLLLLIPLLFSGCSNQEVSPISYAWIDVPIDGLKISMNTIVQIEGHASHPDGISQVELFINNDQIAVLNNLKQDNGLASFSFQWLPPEPGEYLVQAIAYDPNGVSGEADMALLIVGDIEPQAVELDEVEESLVQEAPTQSSSDFVIDFWPDPAEIQAGDCTKIQWYTENVERVIFGGVEQSMEGSYHACLCEDEIFTLRVVLNDGTEETRKVTVIVNGNCNTEIPDEPAPPVSDVTPPSVPSLVVPANGLELSCRGSQALNWIPASDTSGIHSYSVQVQRHSGDNNWTDIAGSVFQDIQVKSQQISVECGWYYRWRVRAKDNANNTSNWSNWSNFIIALS